MLDLNTILALISEAITMPVQLITIPSRRRDIGDARSLMVFFANKEGHSRKEIIDFLNFETKSAVNWHIKKVENLVTRDRMMQDLYTLCSRKIKSYKLETATYGR